MSAINDTNREALVGGDVENRGKKMYINTINTNMTLQKAAQSYRNNIEAQEKISYGETKTVKKDSVEISKEAYRLQQDADFHDFIQRE